MRVFTYSEARQNLAALLALAQKEEVVIRRKDGSTFSLRAKDRHRKSPFDVPGTQTQATTTDVLDAVRESRAR
jgi:nitrite reductase/ring-hydroxylating ferredoxin subunit